MVSLYLSQPPQRGRRTSLFLLLTRGGVKISHMHSPCILEKGFPEKDERYADIVTEEGGK